MNNEKITLGNATRDIDAVTAIVHSYFDGLHHGDITKLNDIFHPDTWLKAPGSRRSLTQWLNDVENRETPAQLNKPFDFKILALDVVQDQAMVKIYCPLFDFHYIDFLGLLKEKGQWRIVTKMYTDTQEQQ
ncbi:MAG: nuclear transport factor 2 family protein [Colwellia sp.]|nr:nuclear transport factor 2 family protein [Colwellia sp.]